MWDSSAWMAPLAGRFLIGGPATRAPCVQQPSTMQYGRSHAGAAGGWGLAHGGTVGLKFGPSSIESHEDRALARGEPQAKAEAAVFPPVPDVLAEGGAAGPARSVLWSHTHTRTLS